MQPGTVTNVAHLGEYSFSILYLGSIIATFGFVLAWTRRGIMFQYPLPRIDNCNKQTRPKRQSRRSWFQYPLPRIDNCNSMKGLLRNCRTTEFQYPLPRIDNCNDCQAGRDSGLRTLFQYPLPRIDNCNLGCLIVDRLINRGFSILYLGSIIATSVMG